MQYPPAPPAAASPLASPAAVSPSPTPSNIAPLPRWRRLAIAQNGGSLLAALHQATQGPHRAFDALLALEGQFELDAYRRLVLGFAAFVPAWEQELAAALSPGWLSWFQQRLRSPLLERDLAELGAAMPAPVPGLERVRLDSLPAAIGSLYVLEVQALAGQLVSRQAHVHGLGPHNGAAFVNGCGEATASRWREFRQRIEHEVRGPAATLQACVAAHLTADALARALRIARRKAS